MRQLRATSALPDRVFSFKNSRAGISPRVMLRPSARLYTRASLLRGDLYFRGLFDLYQFVAGRDGDGHAVNRTLDLAAGEHL